MSSRLLVMSGFFLFLLVSVAMAKAVDPDNWVALAAFFFLCPLIGAVGNIWSNKP